MPTTDEKLDKIIHTLEGNTTTLAAHGEVLADLVDFKRSTLTILDEQGKILKDIQHEVTAASDAVVRRDDEVRELPTKV